MNFYGVNNVIHYGLPREMDTFVKQMGRGGRDGELADELILYKTHKGHLKKVESDLVRLAKDDSKCRHKLLCSDYMVKSVAVSPLHNCCDVCEKQCSCGGDECPRKHVATINVTMETESSSEDEMKRTVSKNELKLLKGKLESLRFQLTLSAAGTLVNSDVIHGFTEDILDDIVQKCNIIFTPDDVMHKFQIWSYEIAVEISNIISDVFGDSEMYHMSETDSDTQSY